MDIDVTSLRSTVEKKADEQRALITELESIEKTQQRCIELEVCMSEKNDG